MAKRKSKKNEWLDWIKAIVIAFIIAFVVRKFLFTPIIVDGPSMMPTLHDRDQLIVNKFNYHFDTPDRFDVVVFHATKKKDFIKRVIGLPGEHVAVKDNILYINGKKMEEPFLEEKPGDMTSYRVLTENFTLEELPGEYKTIPKNHVLVLGDNRSNSVDSRILGLISLDQIVGKTSLLYWPLNRIQLMGE